MGCRTYENARPNHEGIEIGKVNKVLPNGKIELKLTHPLAQNDFIRIVSKEENLKRPKYKPNWEFLKINGNIKEEYAKKHESD